MSDLIKIFDTITYVMHIKMNILGFSISFWNLFIYIVVASLVICFIRRIFF